MEYSLFKNWKSRCHNLGKLLSYQEKISQKQLDEITQLISERDTGLNKNGNKVRFTSNKEERLKYLEALRDKKEELPAGVKTHLDSVFRDVFWGRKRFFSSDKITKGTDCETDSLQLISDIDGFYYAENKDPFENDFLTGEPDNYQINIKEIKSSYDQESFDNATLTSIYKWQVKGYCYLTGKKDGELIYVLVNTPLKDLDKKIYYLKDKYDFIDTPTLEFIEEAQQLERNMIFDIEKWNEEYPNYQWYNTEFDFEIPKELRHKRFHVELEDKDVDFIEKRVQMARDYLMDKEKAVLEELKTKNIDKYNEKVEFIKNKLK